MNKLGAVAGLVGLPQNLNIRRNAERAVVLKERQHRADDVHVDARFLHQRTPLIGGQGASVLGHDFKKPRLRLDLGPASGARAVIDHQHAVIFRHIEARAIIVKQPRLGRAHLLVVGEPGCGQVNLGTGVRQTAFTPGDDIDECIDAVGINGSDLLRRDGGGRQDKGDAGQKRSRPQSWVGHLGVCPDETAQ